MKKVKNPKRVASGKRSKVKGNRGENEVAKLFAAWWGAEFTRTPSSGGFGTKKFRKDWNSAGDIVTPDAKFPFCVEVKNVKDWDLSSLLTSSKCILWKYWEQAVEEAKESNKIPILVFKKNRGTWFCMTPALAGVMEPEPLFTYQGDHGTLWICELSVLHKNIHPSTFSNTYDEP